MAGRSLTGWQIRVRGLVQGVGFRPSVWRLATEAGLAGDVLNDGAGILIRLAASQDQLDQFLERLQQDAPALARIDSIEVTAVDPPAGHCGFKIIASAPGSVETGIVPDAATCPDCLKDIRNPENRRFGYAFTNCTNCGPRLSITRAIPYDRANTSMQAFRMCAACQREYDDPADRRFHAQPNACPICGPQLELVTATGKVVRGDPIDRAGAMLRDGQILAIKGLGGFQLACDATDAVAVATLRQRKHRAAKPFALIARDLRQVAQFAGVDEVAGDILCSPAAPIVLLPALGDPARGVCAEVAPGQTHLGVMLPNTPLHHMLLHRLDRPLVMTSGNLAGEPQISDNAEALQRLAGIADAWLRHDREIVNRLDDSVMQIVSGQPHLLRRARGFAPAPLQLHKGFAEAAPVLACGADLKTTFCLLQRGQAIVSPHIGDMENPRTIRAFQHNLGLLSDTHDFTAAAVAIDMHPGYFSARMGQETAGADRPVIKIQHHHAHVAAVLAEHGHGPEVAPVLGVVLDGLGQGADGTIWGAEFLLADFHRSERLAHFLPVALPGGDKASRQPWRNLLAHLMAAFGPDAMQESRAGFGDLPILTRLQSKPVATVAQMIDRKMNAPLASSAGRLFDAIAAALGLCFDEIQFEGQAAMALQGLAEHGVGETGTYAFETGSVIEWRGLWSGLLGDLQAGVPAENIAARAHNTIAAVIDATVETVLQAHGDRPVVLSGGVFQNRLLLTAVSELLQARGRRVLAPSAYPANDGGLSLGQATTAAAQMLRR